MKKKKKKPACIFWYLCVYVLIHSFLVFPLYMFFVYTPLVHKTCDLFWLFALFTFALLTLFIHLSILSPNPKLNPMTQKCFLCTYLLSQRSKRKKKKNCLQTGKETVANDPTKKHHLVHSLQMSHFHIFLNSCPHQTIKFVSHYCQDL